jgi:hypothetical protein
MEYSHKLNLTATHKFYAKLCQDQVHIYDTYTTGAVPFVNEMVKVLNSIPLVVKYSYFPSSLKNIEDNYSAITKKIRKVAGVKMVDITLEYNQRNMSS